MFAYIISASVRHRVFVLIATLLLVAAGVRAFATLPIDAVPDLTNVQVQVLTNAPALGPIDVERLVTVPVEHALSGIPHVTELRSLSLYGVSAITIVFDDSVDPYFANTRVAERMPRIRTLVPTRYGVPEVGPMSTGLGEIYQFEVRSSSRTLMELRTILDWQVAPRLRLVPGVVEVNTFGGEAQTLELAIDPNRILATQISLQDLFAALEHNNGLAGGGALRRGAQGLLVRGDALIDTPGEARDIAVLSRDGVALYAHQIGEVHFAPMLRQGAATRDGRGEVVVGMAMMLTGANSRTVARAIDREVRLVNATLPRDVRLDPFYDRTALVDRTIRTVAKNLLEGGVLVIVVLVLMLRNLRAGLIAAAVIPLAMLFAFLGMKQAGLSGNLMSLGAIDFGLVVDGSIILLENAVFHIAQECTSLGRPLTREERDDVVLRSALEVRTATAFGELIIAIVYLPVLTLEGIEGRLFRPMALTVVFALAGAFILSLTFVPALASLLLPANARDLPSPIVVGARRIYDPALRITLAHPKTTALVAAVVLVVSIAIGSRLGSEFVPRLDEGALAIEMLRTPSVSLEEAARQAGVSERVLKSFPEVITVISKTGRPEIANDPMGTDRSDVIVALRPRTEWRAGYDRERLITEMERALRRAVPGVSFGFSQPIEMRTNELVSGVRADVAVKVYGDDFGELQRYGRQIERLLSGVRGAADLRTDRVAGSPVLSVKVNRTAIARRGATADDVLDAVETIGGHTVGTAFEGRRQYPLRARWALESRSNLASIRRLPVRSSTGFALLEELADVSLVDEPAIVNHEALQRRLVVQANVRHRDLGGFADEAQAVVAREVHLPPGYRLEWGGQFENLRRARARLFIVVPIALALVIGLLFMTFREISPALLIFVNVPFAASGGILALAVRGLPFSISAGVGLVALFGVAVMNGLVLVSQIRVRRQQGAGPAEAAHDGAMRRLRPVLTTALVASLGFLPMALAQGQGAEVQRPLATVVIGGLITSTALTLLVLPALSLWFLKWVRVSGHTTASRPSATPAPAPHGE